jgi:hypothetical protein
LGRTDQEIVGGLEGQKLMAIKRAVLDSGAARLSVDGRVMDIIAALFIMGKEK